MGHSTTSVLAKTLLISLCALLLHAKLYSQNIGGRDSGDPSPAEVKPHALNKGALQGDVNLFSGSYGTSYNLGTVSGPSGLNYSVSLNYSNSTTGGHSIPHVNGVPYGNGWNISLPSISISTQAYNKFSQEQTNSYLNNAHIAYEFNSSEANEEGQLYSYSPYLSIPGVASGRLVFKEQSGSNEFTFVLNTFEQYIEVELKNDGREWWVHLPDGTVYILQTAMVSYRAASNQRMYDDYNAHPGADVLGNVSNIVLPKQEILSWYVSQIYNKNLPSERILFDYQTFGNFNYFKEFFNKYVFARFLANYVSVSNVLVFKPEEWKRMEFNTAKEIILRSVKVVNQEVGATLEQLDLIHEYVDLNGGYLMIDPQDDNVFKKDDLYYGKVERYWGINTNISGYPYGTVFTVPTGNVRKGFNGWNRYRHWKSDALLSNAMHNEMSSTNPYIARTNNGPFCNIEPVPYGEKDVALPFNHAYIESERISMSGLPCGETYEIRSFIRNGNLGVGWDGYCDFDINIVSGIHPSGYSPTPSGSVNYNDIEEHRDYTIFTTFNQAIKWNSVNNYFPITKLLVTSNYFTMPYLPNKAGGFNIQIGPANSDINHTPEFDKITLDEDLLGEPSAYLAYENMTIGIPSLKRFQNVPHNFGIGMPWHMIHDTYDRDPNDPFAHISTHHMYRYWWNDGGQNVDWDNVPTKADENVDLEGVALIRYSKVPYMLKRVRHYKVNGDYDYTPTNSSMVLVNEIVLDYDIKTPTYNPNPFDNDNIPDNDYKPAVSMYNVIFLKSIRQIPVDPSKDNIGFTFDSDKTPAIFFEYGELGPERVFAMNILYTAGKVFVLTKITDQMGGITELEYYPLNSSATVISHKYSAKYHTAWQNSSLGQLGKLMTEQLVFQIDPVINKKKYHTQHMVSPQVWEYIYDAGDKIQWDQLPSLSKLDKNRKQSMAMAGFKKVKVIEPSIDIAGSGPVPAPPFTMHYFRDQDIGTALEQFCLFGKLYRIEQYDQYGATSKLVKKTEIEYGVTHAYHNGVYRRNSPADKATYKDILNNGLAGIDDFQISFAGYNGFQPTKFAESLEEFYTLGYSNFYKNSYFIKKTKETVTEYENMSSPTFSYNGGQISLGAGSSTSVKSPLYFKIMLGDTEGNACNATTGQEKSLEKSAKLPLVNKAFYPVLTRPKETYHSEDLQIVTEYEYWEANANGLSQCNGYKVLLIDESTGAEQLYYEPSWQLYRKKTFSLQQANINTTEEYFYYYDVANDGNYGFNNLSIYGNEFDGLELSHLHRMRNIPYEVRSTYVKLNEIVKQSQYFHYDSRWTNSGVINTITVNADLGICPEEITHPYTSAIRNCGCFDIKVENAAFLPEPPDGFFLLKNPYANLWYFCPNSAQNCTDAFILSINGGQPIINDYPNWELIQHLGLRNPPIELVYDDGYNLIFDPLATNPSVPDIIDAGILIINHLDDPLATTVNTGLDATVLHPTLAKGVNDGPPTIQFLYNLGSPLGNSLLLRAVFVQVDEKPFGGYLDDYSLQGTIVNPNEDKFYITRFNPSETSPALSPNASSMVMPTFPFLNLRNKTVLERNRFAQAQLTEDEKGLQTFVHYEEPYRIWHVNTNNATNKCSNYFSVMLSNLGMPKCIKVGFDLPNEQTTCFEFWPDKSVKKITDPNAMFTGYTYDEYGRLKESFLNGERLNLNKYGYWENDHGLTFRERTLENYVESFLFTERNSDKAVQTRGYFDPLGREYVNIKRTVADAGNLTNTGNMVVSGMPVFNQWDMPVKQYQPFEVALNTGQPFEMVLNTDGSYPQYHQSTAVENSHRKRPQRNADFGVMLYGAYNTTKTYRIVRGGVAVAELGMAPSQALLYFPFAPGYYRVRVETTHDQDGKQTDHYSNVFGQKIATRQHLSATQKLVTFFEYDAKGNLVKVTNPAGQESEYKYNLLGQLYEKTTVDGGTTRYMYNKSGQVTWELDAKGTAEGYLRYYEFDVFGRPTAQGRTTHFGGAALYSFPLNYAGAIEIHEAGNPTGQTVSFSSRQTLDWLFTKGRYQLNTLSYPEGFEGNYNPSYSIANDPAKVPEKTFRYDFADATGLHLTANAAHYTDAHWHKLLGRPAVTVSHDNDGAPVLYTLLSYNAEGRLEWELQQFNEKGITGPDKGTAVRIDYPAYGLQGNLLEKNVDVHADQQLDFQYRYGYDHWNRLGEVYASFDGSGTGGRLLASYHYKAATGLLNTTKYYAEDGNGNPAVTDELAYTYDTRYRLTGMASTLFDWELYYDNLHPFTVDPYRLGLHRNHNGNVNATVGTYKLDHAGMVPPSSFSRRSTAYGYRYDGINRLTAADCHMSTISTPGTPGGLPAGHEKYGDESYGYDAVGNIAKLYRTTVGSAANDHYLYAYQPGTNRLTGISRNGISDTYTYDPNGNLLTDTYRHTEVTSYGRANLPTSLNVTGGNNAAHKMLYNAADTRIFKGGYGGAKLLGGTFYLKDATGSELGLMDTDDEDNTEWEWYVYGTNRFAKVGPGVDQQPSAGPVAAFDANSPATYGGYTFFEDTDFDVEPEFYIHDHLGNTRVVYTPTVGPYYTSYNLSALIDYFPYGKILRSYYNGEEERYLTTHHERDAETGLDYRGARFYDSDNGRFLSLDPLAMEFADWSGYNYVLGNPVLLVDPDGRSPQDPITRACKECSPGMGGGQASGRGGGGGGGSGGSGSGGGGGRGGGGGAAYSDILDYDDMLNASPFGGNNPPGRPTSVSNFTPPTGAGAPGAGVINGAGPNTASDMQVVPPSSPPPNQLQINNANGKMAENMVFNSTNAANPNSWQQITARPTGTGKGANTRMDIFQIKTNGNGSITEVKFGGARLTPNQNVMKSHIDSGNGYIELRTNIPGTNYKKGSTIYIENYTITRISIP